jgi:isoleucyl-tRNA synthetase
MTAEEVWRYLPGASDEAESVHLAEWDAAEAAAEDDALEAKFSRLLKVRALVLKELEEARAAGDLGHPLEAAVSVTADGETYELLAEEIENLPTYFITSQVELHKGKRDGGPPVVAVAKTRDEKCQRCWQRLPSVGEDAEKPDVCARCRGVLEKISAG